MNLLDECLAQYDAIEVHPCAMLDGGSVEQCSQDDPDLAMWSVYGHLKNPGGLEWIADFEGTDTGAEFAAQYAVMLENYMNIIKEKGE